MERTVVKSSACIPLAAVPAAVPGLPPSGAWIDGRRLPRCITLAFCSTLLAPLIAAATPGWVQPGLYRIDTTGEVTNAHGKAKARLRTDGATGDTTVHTSLEDGRARHAYRGEGAVTRCIQPLPAGAPASFLSAADPGCTEQSTTWTEDGFVHVGQCRNIRTTVKGRRVNDETWDFDHESVTIPGTTTPDMSGLRAQLQHAATQGPPEQRAQAAAALAALPDAQARQAEARAQALASMAAAKARARTPAAAAAYERGLQALRQNWNGDEMRIVRHERWTRIALTCAAGAP